MCLEDIQPRVHKQVRGYKIFQIWGRRITALVYPELVSYRVGKVTRSKNGPGIQAFCHEEDAILTAQESWLQPSRVLPVILYNARQGIITGMCHTANGRPAWIASKIKVLRSKARG